MLSPDEYAQLVIMQYQQQVLPFWGEDHHKELEVLVQFQEFLKLNGPVCFDNHFAPGHVTGSALVVTPDFSKIVLTLHKKLKKWVQLGGHADGYHKIHEVALREAQEESGLKELTLYGPHFTVLDGEKTPLPLDFDIHQIPTHKNTPAHKHYDIRYAIIASDFMLKTSDESDDLRWFTLEEAFKVCEEESMHRQLWKMNKLKGGK